MSRQPDIEYRPVFRYRAEGGMLQMTVSVEVYEDGKVSLHSRYGLAAARDMTISIAQEDISHILKMFAEKGFFEMQDDYTNGSNNLLYVLECENGMQRKRVAAGANGKAPKNFWTLMWQLDRLLVIGEAIR